MGVLLERLEAKGLLVSDGACGTLLHAKGMTAGDCPEEWNVSHPDIVCQVPAAYAAAGSDLVLTNSFGGSAFKLARRGLEDRTAAFNSAAARLAVEAAPEAVVAGSVGPTGEFLEPFGAVSVEKMEAVFTEQIAALMEGGAHAICIETMTAVEEAACAVRAAKRLDPAADVICTMTFEAGPGGYRTMMGVDPAAMAEVIEAAGADILGANCGNGIEQMIPLARAFQGLTKRPLLFHANAGLPELVNGETVFRQSPEEIAAHVEALVNAGARIVGGCCGTTPAHIAAIRAEIDRLRAA